MPPNWHAPTTIHTRTITQTPSLMHAYSKIPPIHAYTLLPKVSPLPPPSSSNYLPNTHLLSPSYKPSYLHYVGIGLVVGAKRG